MTIGRLWPLPRKACAAWLVGAAAACALTPASTEAAGESYNLLRCHEALGRYTQPGDLQAQTGYGAVDKCSQAISDWSYQLKSQNAVGAGRYAVVSWTAPSGTVITGISMDHDMRTADHHYAEIQTDSATLFHAPNAPGGFTHFSQGGLHAAVARVILSCSDAGGCPASAEAHAFVRNVSIELTDLNDPSLTVAGPLVSTGWKRGSPQIAAVASDVGSGIRYLDVQVNGAGLSASVSISCNGQVPRYTIYAPPCGAGGMDVTPSTGSHPFHNGSNTVQVVTKDFAGNTTWSPEYTVLVDNKAPTVAFANSQDHDDPELIRAVVSDGHSGLATAKLYMRRVGADEWEPLDTRVQGGEAQARVDSAGLPAGNYEFRATTSDVAGNGAETTTRQNGDPMRLTFPLREAVELQAHLGDGGSKGQTVPYGTPSEVAGRLTDPSGEPIANKDVLVVEHFGDGALIRERPTTLTTDADGRFSTKIPAGPTRRVTAKFAGTRKYRSADAAVGEFTVKSGATFKLAQRSVPEGGTATFKGKVGHFGARIPSGGKLIELQVRLKTGRWETVGEAFRTNEKGRYVRHYRFGKHYTADALFRFRIKVQKEGNWPYKRAASAQLKLVVRAS
jgi:hypothetical protein